MPELEALLERADRAVERVPLSPGGVERVERGARVRRRNARIRAGVVGLAVLAVIALVADRVVLRSEGLPADQTPRIHGLFDGLGGWVPYQSEGDLYIVDPDAPGSAPRPLIDVPGASVVPLSWSSDGRRLLVARYDDGEPRTPSLQILEEDGTLTPVLAKSGTAFGALAPDGSVFVEEPFRVDDGVSARVVRIDPATGSSLPFGPQLASGADWNPAVAPDGTVAVLHVDTGSVSVDLISPTSRETIVPASALPVVQDVSGLEWSPDGTHLVFALYGARHANRLYVVASDGSDLREIAMDAISPSWSPDGSRIAYVRDSDDALMTVAHDGSAATELGVTVRWVHDVPLRVGPWAPLGVAPMPQPAETTTTTP